VKWPTFGAPSMPALRATLCIKAQVSKRAAWVSTVSHAILVIIFSFDVVDEIKATHCRQSDVVGVIGLLRWLR
jgi:hypothetical protein